MLDSLLLQVQQALLSSLQTFQVLHQLPHVISGLPGLCVSKPAAPQGHQDGQGQNPILPSVAQTCWPKQEHRLYINSGKQESASNQQRDDVVGTLGVELSGAPLLIRTKFPVCR